MQNQKISKCKEGFHTKKKKYLYFWALKTILKETR